MRADFHIHSMYSDGSDTSDQIFKLAKKAGVDVISITDHDTLQGREIHYDCAKKYGIHYVPGVEVSAYDYRRHRPCHIIGLAICTGVFLLESMIANTLSQRHRISHLRVEKLMTMGYDISFRDFKPSQLEQGLYKQHIMEVLIKKGYAKSLYGDYYQNNFKNGGPLDFKVDYPTHIEAIEAIIAAQGIPILAHPSLYDNFSAIEEMIVAGLMGIEGIYPYATEQARQRCLEVVVQHELFLSGGSDYHGRYADKSGGVIGQYCIDLDNDNHAVEKIKNLFF